MGIYTAHSDPIVDETVKTHLDEIVRAICSYLKPTSIILYGSFGRGEGSVLLDNGQLKFLSDYEINVVTSSPFYRQRFSELSRQMTKRLGVDTGITWMRTGRLYTNQSQNLSFGKAKRPTIDIYELKQGGKTIYGRHLLDVGPPIDPQQIPLGSGIRLLRNRMAEAINRWPGPTLESLEHLESARRMNKVILACAESLLLAWGAYHFSYAERGRRFAVLATDHIQHIQDSTEVEAWINLVERATAFKLQPSSKIWDNLSETWSHTLHFADATFRHLLWINQGMIFDTYAQFPDKYLQYVQTHRAGTLYRFPFIPSPYHQKLIDALKYLRQRQLPPRGFFNNLKVTVSQIVYAVIPALFMSLETSENRGSEIATELLPIVRHWLEITGDIEGPNKDPQLEWNTLRQRTMWAWYNFCVN